MRFPLPGSFTYFQCLNCGCLQIGDIPDRLRRYYPKNYYSFDKVAARKLFDSPVTGFLRRQIASLGSSKNQSARVFQKMLRFPTHHEWFRYGNVSLESTILDIGSGSGSLLVRIWKEGFANAAGVDPFIEEDIYYRNGVEIRKAFINEIEKDGYYDFIMLNHSLEHMPDQFDTFRNLKRLLKVGGIVLIRIPVSNSYAWEKYKTNWVNLDAPRHLFLHSETSLQLLADHSGLCVENVVYDSLEFQFYGSELCKRGIPISRHKDYMQENGQSLFGKGKMSQWKKLCKELNKGRKGDMACFYLRKV